MRRAYAAARRSGTPDRAAEQLAAPKLSAATLALDREGRAERRVAGGAAAQYLAAALRARRRHLGLELLEPAARGPAPEAHGSPVAEHVAALLAQPVRSLAHATTLAAEAGRPESRPARHRPR